MESSPAGQLGGVDASESVRKRMAGESRGWRCSVCGGKSCEEILGEVERAAKELEAEQGEGSTAREEEKVPPEMQFAIKKDAGEEKKDEAQNEGKAPAARTEDETARQPEIATQPYPPARPAQTVPQPTATIPLPPQAQVQAQFQPQPQRQMAQVHVRSNDGVPIWVDRAIAGIVVCLVAMVLKMLLGK
jgi:ubiquitin-conjugating enzyme E2 J1